VTIPALPSAIHAYAPAGRYGGSALLSDKAGPAEFRTLIRGIVPDSRLDEIVAIACDRRSELSQTDHGTWVGDTDLERRWYRSVANGSPDYGVYSDDAYLSDCWAGWIEYSRDSLRKLCPPKSYPPHGVLGDLNRMGVSTILDLGCGMGLTTAALTELFPDARVTGTNIPGNSQYSVAERLASRYGFTMVPETDPAFAPVDLVLASEYFEHFESPIEHLNEVLDHLRPRAMVIANAFNVSSIGHFPSYLVNGSRVDGRATSRAFSSTMKRRGYVKLPTAIWNGRPSYWRCTASL